jgi:signal peptidase I
MYLALREVARNKGVKGDVLVYNDSRIVDELNGQIQPLDDICRKWQQLIRRELVPSIRSLVFFRKKHGDYVQTKVEIGASMLSTNDPVVLRDIANKAEVVKTQQARSLKARVLDRFKRTWNNEC